MHPVQKVSLEPCIVFYTLCFNDINVNLPRALPRAIPAQRRGKILLYRFVLSNGGVPGLEIRRVGWGSYAGCY